MFLQAQLPLLLLLPPPLLLPPLLLPLLLSPLLLSLLLGSGGREGMGGSDGSGAMVAMASGATDIGD